MINMLVVDHLQPAAGKAGITERTGFHVGAEVRVDGKHCRRYLVLVEEIPADVVALHDDAQKPVEAEGKLEEGRASLRSVTPKDPTPRASSGRVAFHREYKRFFRQATVRDVTTCHSPESTAVTHWSMLSFLFV